MITLGLSRSQCPSFNVIYYKVWLVVARLTQLFNLFYLINYIHESNTFRYARQYYFILLPSTLHESLTPFRVRINFSDFYRETLSEKKYSLSVTWRATMVRPERQNILKFSMLYSFEKCNFKGKQSQCKEVLKQPHLKMKIAFQSRNA